MYPYEVITTYEGRTGNLCERCCLEVASNVWVLLYDWLAWAALQRLSVCGTVEVSQADSSTAIARFRSRPPHDDQEYTVTAEDLTKALVAMENKLGLSQPLSDALWTQAG
jgi:hypothetical protein